LRIGNFQHLKQPPNPPLIGAPVAVNLAILAALNPECNGC
jgi:hypothetical protein